MPFGLKNDSTPFQSVMDIKLYLFKWKFAFAYIDDMVIFPQIPREHISYTRLVFSLLKEAGLTL